MITRRGFLTTTATAGVATAWAAEGGAAPRWLRCEYRENPLGLDVERPRFAWRLAEGVQEAYELKVQLKGRPVWESGWVETGESAQVEYGGPRLESRGRYEWRVRVKRAGGAVSAWSAAAWFEMGLLRAEEWKGQWMTVAGLETAQISRTSPSPWFRAEFEVRDEAAGGRVYASGLGFYEIYLNGQRLGQDVLAPNQTDYDKRRLGRLIYPFDDQTVKRVLYDVYDVTGLLKKGKNVVGVVLGNGWYNQRERLAEGYLWYSTPRAIVQVEGAGGETLCVSGTHWKVTTAGPIVHNGLFTGEDYDARLAMPGWSAVGFDDSAWIEAVLAAAPAGPLRAGFGVPDRVVETRPMEATERLADGTLVYDAGRNFSGWVRVQARGPRGRKLALRYVEDSGRDYEQTDSYVCAGGGVETWEPRFTWHAFRKVEVRGAAEAPKLEARVVHSDVKRAGRFECSNELLTKVHETYVHTQLMNMHGGVTSDCPHRERLGYTGDGQVAAQAAIYALEMAPFYTKWIEDIADARNHKTGYVPHTAPFEGGGGGPPWGAAMVLMPWYMYLYYGDRRMLERHFEAMRMWVEYLGTRCDGRGVVVKEEPGGWFLGDWCPPKKIAISPEFVCTCHYAQSAELTAKAAAILGKKEEQARLTAVAGRVKAAVQEHFYEPGAAQYAGGIQGANFYPLAFGMTPEPLRAAVLERGIAILKEGGDHFDTGFVGTPLVLDALTAGGRADYAYRLMTQPGFPGFGHMLAQGATTLWEDWDGRSSRMHPMFGGACRWLWQGLAGLNPVEAAPGFARFLVQPRPVGDLKWLKARYESVRGPIGVEWSQEGGRFRMRLEVPGNARALVRLPDGTEKEAGPGTHSF